MTVLLALLGSILLGASDFLGGVASRTRSALTVTVAMNAAALVVLAPIAALLGADDVTGHDLALGAGSGLVTGIAYVLFFSAIGHGRISTVVPVSAATSAIIPVVVGVVGDGNALSAAAAVGVGCAIVAIPLVAYQASESRGEEAWSPARQVTIAALAGLGFGTFFVALGHTSQDSGLWPTVAALAAAFTVSGLIAAATHKLPSARDVPRMALLSGVALAVAEVGITISLQRGPLTVASVLGNLYPVTAVALGVIVLGERMRSWQGVGVVLALLGVVLIAAG